MNTTILDGTLTFDTEQTPLELRAAGEVPDRSLSGLYLTVHLPGAANRAKLALALTRTAVPLKVTVLFDQPEGRAGAELLATAGASRYPVELAARMGSGQQVRAEGVTGETLAAVSGW
jgi:hypothetical protein